MQAFFQLLQVAIGASAPESLGQHSREEWEAMYATARKQALLGVSFMALDMLPREDRAPLGVYTRWALMAEKIEGKNHRLQEREKELVAMFTAEGFRSCILKGQGVARYYPAPDMRQCGDIDIWVEGDRDRIFNFLKGRYKLYKTIYNHTEAKIFDDVEVEVHYTPSWMNSFRLNARLQDFFARNAEAQFNNFDESLGVSVPDDRFNGVFLLLHIFRHVLMEGIGLRQVLDYYYLLKRLSTQDRSSVMASLKELELDGFAAALMYVLKAVFALEDEYMLCQPSDKDGKFLLDEILQSGNFGTLDSRNAHAEKESIAAHAVRKLSRVAKFAGRYPSEALFTPVFMTWQFFWRKKNGYLYKGR